MVDFHRVQGTLLVGESAEEDERIEGGDELYSVAVFDAGDFALRFATGIGGYYNVSENHIVDSEYGQVYYPYQNETTVEPHFDFESQEMDVFADNVFLEYAGVGDSLYVRSQNEITAYGGTYLVRDDNLYKILPSLLFRPDEPSNLDSFLGIDERIKEPVRVRNVETGDALPREYEEVASVVENDEPNGALKVREPENVLSRFLRNLD